MTKLAVSFSGSSKLLVSIISLFVRNKFKINCLVSRKKFI